MINKNILILFFAFIFCSFLIQGISAAQPQTNVNLEVGLEIQYPIIETLEQGTYYDFQFHVFNKSNGLGLSNDTTSCRFHLYNSTGGEFIDQDLTMNINLVDFEIYVLGGNFTIGSYSYITQCNTSNYGGFVAVPIEVTPTGEDLTTSKSVLILGNFLILLVGIVLFTITGLIVKYPPFKIFLLSMAMLLMMLTIGYGASLKNIIGITDGGIMSGMYILFTVLIIGGFLGLLVYLIAFVVKMFQKSRGILDDDGDD